MTQLQTRTNTPAKLVSARGELRGAWPCGKSCLDQAVGQLWLDHNVIIVVRPTAFYLPLAAAVVEWQKGVAVHKRLDNTTR